MHSPKSKLLYETITFENYKANEHSVRDVLGVWLLDEGVKHLRRNIGGLKKKADAEEAIHMFCKKLFNGQKVLTQVLTAKKGWKTYLRVALSNFGFVLVEKNRKQVRTICTSETSAQDDEYFIESATPYDTLVREEAVFIKKMRKVLSPSHFRVMRLRVKGFELKEIAPRLGLTYETVKTYSTQARQELKKYSLDYFELN